MDVNSLLCPPSFSSSSTSLCSTSSTPSDMPSIALCNSPLSSDPSSPYLVPFAAALTSPTDLFPGSQSISLPPPMQKQPSSLGLGIHKLRSHRRNNVLSLPLDSDDDEEEQASAFVATLPSSLSKSPAPSSALHDFRFHHQYHNRPQRQHSELPHSILERRRSSTSSSSSSSSQSIDASDSMQLDLSNLTSLTALHWPSRQLLPSPTEEYHDPYQYVQPSEACLSSFQCSQLSPQTTFQQSATQFGMSASTSMGLGMGMDMDCDILVEAAKRAEMEILAADIDEMQF
ncbi:uncharacterized protein V1516DRAFT_665515 [Lipomyces oligophaga]|uniref:uncharacterized protein n=1 Tax=Lipomyces oligophaga TaxID=45792 RepID=UPI0034CE7602